MLIKGGLFFRVVFCDFKVRVMIRIGVLGEMLIMFFFGVGSLFFDLISVC